MLGEMNHDAGLSVFLSEPWHYREIEPATAAAPFRASRCESSFVVVTEVSCDSSPPTTSRHHRETPPPPSYSSSSFVVRRSRDDVDACSHASAVRLSQGPERLQQQQQRRRRRHSLIRLPNFIAPSVGYVSHPRACSPSSAPPSLSLARQHNCTHLIIRRSAAKANDRALNVRSLAACASRPASLACLLARPPASPPRHSSLSISLSLLPRTRTHQTLPIYCSS